MIFDRKDAGRDSEEGPQPTSPDDPEAEADDLESMLSTQVESILEAAEEAAAGIRKEAQERASTYLSESREKADEIAAERIRQISELTDSLLARVRTVARQSDELISALDAAGRRVKDETASSEAGAPPPPVQPQAPQVPPAPQAPGQPADRPPPRPRREEPPVSDGARLLATQMAVAGSSRDEIAWRLQDEFGISDSTAILDETGV